MGIGSKHGIVASVAGALVIVVPFGGCGSSSSNGDAAGDAATSTGHPSAATDPVGASDAGNADFTMYEAPDAGGPLEAHIQVNGGGQLTCGGCAVILAQTQGGKRPYSYAWTDPSWTGPGPFQLCPDAPTSISLTVTDSSASSGENPTADQSVAATTPVDCTARNDAAAPGPLNGCTGGGTAGSSYSVPDSGPDSGIVECSDQEVEGGVAWADGGPAAVVSGALGVTLQAGHAYGASYDPLLPIVLGQPVIVEIWGAADDDPCTEDQKLFTLDLDGSLQSWHETFCFTPDRDYHRVVTKVFVKGVWLFFDVLAFTTFCDTCSM
jgi:hypothetical protein